MKKYLFYMCLVLCSLCLAGCRRISAGEPDGGNAGSRDEPASREIFAMDTYMTVTAYGDNAKKAVTEAVARITKLDEMLSAEGETGEIAGLNACGKQILSEDALRLVESALSLWRDTDGAFNPAIYPLMELWGFPDRNFRVPDADELAEVLPLTNADNIVVCEESGEVSFKKDGMKLDLGGIAKGYTSAEIIRLFRENGITKGLVSLGGNVQALGTKPDGTCWRIAIRHPYDQETYLGILEIADKAVITSGGYERYFEQDGKRYHHILDAKTGYPAQNGLVSVTIVSGDGTLADGLSTALFVMGQEKAAEYWRAHCTQFDIILYTEDGELFVSEGISDRFTSDYPVKVVTATQSR